MVYFLIGAPLIDKTPTEQQTLQVLNKAIGNCAEPYPNETQRFKLGNVDTLLHNIEIMQKMETQFEGFLRKIERQYLETTNEIETKFTVDTSDASLPIPQYLKKFKWQDAKFPRTQALGELVGSLKKRVDKIDEAFRKKAHEYQEEKNKLQSLTSKEGNLYVRDLADVFKPEIIKEKDFYYSDHITTVVVVVPKAKEQEFLKQYNSATENVLPGSAKKFDIEDKDQLNLYRVILYKTEYIQEVVQRLQNEKIDEQARKVIEEDRKQKERDPKITDEEKKQIERERQQDEEQRIQKAKSRKVYKNPVDTFAAVMREKLQVTVREFKYNKRFYENREQLRTTAQSKSDQEKKLLTELCKNSFSELYLIYVHLKYLRMVVDIAARFGRDTVVTAIVHPPAGKEKKVVNELTNIYCLPNQKGFYGDKDEIEDTEDFYPFVYIPITHI